MNLFKQPLTRPMTLRDYRKSIEEDIEIGAKIRFYEKSKEKITVCDKTDGDKRIYSIVNPTLITKDWIYEKMITTPSVNELGYDLDLEGIAKYLDKNVNTNYFLTLENIVFCNDPGKDWDYLHSFDDVFEGQMETHVLPDKKELGAYWEDVNKIFINVGGIVKRIEDQVREGYAEAWETEDAINEDLMLTLLKEVRYLAFGNPYLPEDILNQKYKDKKFDAERYAISIYSKNTAIFITEAEKNYEPELSF